MQCKFSDHCFPSPNFSYKHIYSYKHICTFKYDGANHFESTVPENYGHMLLSK